MGYGGRDMDGADLNLGRFESSPPVVSKVQRDVSRAVDAGRGQGSGSVRGVKPPQGKTLGLVWSGLAGFVAGAVCWHFVGFWGFMTDAVLYARPEGGAKGAVRVAGSQTKNQSRQPGAATAVANCLIAGRDKAGGEAQTRGCEGHTFKFHPSRNIVKADRGDFGPSPVPTLISGQGIVGAAVSGWSARVEPSGETGVGVKKAD